MTQPAPAHEPHDIEPPPEQDDTVRKVAELLLVGAAAVVTAAAIAKLLGLPKDAITLALKLSDHDGTKHRGTKHTPRARGAGKLERAAAKREAFYRAAFVISAGRRIAGRLGRGMSPADAVRPERGYWAAHEKARRARQEASRAVADAARTQTVEQGVGLDEVQLGWYAHKDDRVTPECRQADGANFSPMAMPLIGFPGMPHGGTCRCVPGPPHDTTRTVDGETAHLVTRSR